MNFLVVDDEPIIRIGLRTLVDWEQHGLHFIGEAADGEEALDMILQGNVDILVTDIRMPKMDGLELIRHTRAVNDDIGILVLSCLDDFAYVKEAMKLGAYDYILKPTMEPDELLSILHTLKLKLQEGRMVKQQWNQWHAQLEQSRPFQIAARIRHYLDAGQPDGKLEEELFDRGSGLYSIMINWAPAIKVTIGEWEFTDSAAAVRWQDNCIFLLYPCESSLSMNEQHNQSYRKALELEQQLFHNAEPDSNNWLLCIGPVIHNLTDLSVNMQLHARQQHSHFYSLSRDSILWDDGMDAIVDCPLPYEQRNDLLRSIANSNADGIFYHAEEISEMLKRMKPPVSKVYGFVFELMGLAVGYAREQGYAHIDDYEQQYVSMEKIQSWFHIDALNQWLAEAMRELWNARWGMTLQVVSSNIFIRKAMQFMKNNYHRNIGTVDISDHVKLSRSYLSDLYSKEMGESLIETLTRIRIDEAKKKLRSGEMKVYEIAEAVGFSDPRSFAKTFKRIVGCTPKEYDYQNK